MSKPSGLSYSCIAELNSVRTPHQNEVPCGTFTQHKFALLGINLKTQQAIEY